MPAFDICSLKYRNLRAISPHFLTFTKKLQNLVHLDAQIYYKKNTSKSLIVSQIHNEQYQPSRLDS